MVVFMYQIDEDLDIFSSLISEYLYKEKDDDLAGIVYIATGPMFCELHLGSLMLCILSYFLFFQSHAQLYINSIQKQGMLFKPGI